MYWRGYRLYIPMIDTLSAKVDISNYENSTKELQEKLERKKEEAKLATTNQASIKITIQIGNFNFQVLPNGKMGYAYILHNELYEVNIAQFRSKNDDFYPIAIKIKAECLWAYSPERAWEIIISWVQNNIGNVIQDKLSRIDLCLHTDKLELTYADIETFKGTYFDENIYRFRRKINGMNFGSRANNKIYCRIYDKLLEVKQTGKKHWFFDVWKNAGSDCKNVWNIEFQINREFLKQYDIETVRDAFKRLKTLWKYCTEKWLVKVKLDHTRIERCSTDEVWIYVQNAFNDFKNEPLVKREVQLVADAEAIIPGTIGNITTFAARKGITDINLILNLIKHKGSDYLSYKDIDFKEAVLQKISLMTI